MMEMLKYMSILGTENLLKGMKNLLFTKINVCFQLLFILFISLDKSGNILYDTTTASRYFTSTLLDTSREFDIEMSIKIGDVEIKSSRMEIVLL